MALTENAYNNFYNNILQPRPYDTLSTNYQKTDVSQNTRGLGQVGSITANAIQDILGNYLSDKFQVSDSDLGRVVGTVASQGVNSALNTVGQNVIKGKTITEGLGQNVGSTLAGVGVGLAAQGIGKGISSAGNNSMLSRGIGQGVATGVGMVGGQVVGNLINGKKAFTGIGDGIKAIKTFNAAKKAGTATQALKDTATAAKWNIAGMAGQVVGSGLQAAFGPSKEYGGKYGATTQTLDTVYDGIQTAVGFIPGWGTVASGAMALNKGLSNVFGSTDGMTQQDAILGSAFMPAPVKWLNMANAHTTDKFNNQSYWKVQKANSFMGDAFGDLNDKFDTARQESGKTYGTFSKGAYQDAQRNIQFANQAWDQILAMADRNELQNIRAFDMSSINNQRYAQQIMGGWSPMARGKHGMKILNNAINHNIGMRLLSGAALIDNKQMILCNVQD